MHHRVLVEVYTPNWQYCDLQNAKSPKHKLNRRCRFCSEIKQRGQNPRCFCTLFNIELRMIGDMVEKTTLCHNSWKGNKILDLRGEPKELTPKADFSPKEATKMAQKAVKQVKKKAAALQKYNIPIESAYDVAIQQTIDELKEG